MAFTEHVYVQNDKDLGFQSDNESISSEEGGECAADDNQRVRTKAIQDIWEEEVIWNGLQTLPGYYDLLELITNQQIDLLIKQPFAKKTGILLASWMGNANALKVLLEIGAPVNTSDESGRTPLHLACCAGCEDSVRMLLEAGASPNKWDSSRKVTPLHCSASRGQVGCLKLLIKYGADVNAGLAGRSPLHYAVESRAVDCVKELLGANAIPNTTQVRSYFTLRSVDSSKYIYLETKTQYQK